MYDKVNITLLRAFSEKSCFLFTAQTIFLFVSGANGGNECLSHESDFMTAAHMRLQLFQMFCGWQWFLYTKQSCIHKAV